MDKNERPDDTIHLDVEIEITDSSTPEEREAQRATCEARIRRDAWNRRWRITLFWAVVTSILLSTGFLVFPSSLIIVAALVIDGAVVGVALFGVVNTMPLFSNDDFPGWLKERMGLHRP